MTFNTADIITDYRERCAQLLRGATPDSDEHIAYSRILQVFDQNQTGEPFDRSLRIAQALMREASSPRALPLAPPEVHAQAARVRKIVAPWVKDFKSDTGAYIRL